MKPTVGRIVLYDVPIGDGTYPAIIVSVIDDEHVDLCVFKPPTPDFRNNVVHRHSGGYHTWRWPRTGDEVTG